MYRTSYLVCIVLFTAVTTACGTTHHLYRADGTVTMPDGEHRNASLYWYEDRGHRLFVWPYTQTDSSINLRVCGVVANSTFDPDEQDKYLELPSDADDLRMAHIDEVGTLELLAEPERMKTGGRCGLILLDDERATIESLEVGTRPVMAILCGDPIRPDTYPAVGTHRFGAVRRTQISADTGEKRSAPEVCAESQTNTLSP